MVELELILASTWALILAALLASAIAYPFVFVGHLFYNWLTEKYENAPKFLLLFVATLVVTLIFLVLLEQYLGASISQTTGALAPGTPTA